MLRRAWFPEEPWSRAELESALGAAPGEADVTEVRIGAAHSAARFWSEHPYRALATDVILSLLAKEEDSVMEAISHVFMAESFPPDRPTADLLDAMLSHPGVLRHGNTDVLLEGLEPLLALWPDKIHGLCDALLNQYGTAVGDISTSAYMLGDRMVSIALGLQQLGGEHAAHGTGLFERMLGLDVPDVRTG